MPFKPDVVLVDIGQTPQVSEPVGTAKAVGDGRWITVAVTCLVKRHDDIAATRELDRKAVLRLARIKIAVHREDSRCRRLLGGVDWNIDKGAHGVALGALETDVFDANSIRGLGEMGEQPAQKDQNGADSCQSPFLTHEVLPLGSPDRRLPAVAAYMATQISATSPAGTRR